MRSVSALLALALLGPLQAEPPLRTPLLASDPAAFQMVKVAEGVHAFLAPEGVTPIVSGNTVVIEGDDGLLVVDPGQFPSVARRHIAAIQGFSRLPVRYLVNTHWHPDHWLANGEYLKAWPGAVLIATHNTRSLAETKAVRFITTTYTASTRAAVAALLAKGAFEGGRALSPIERSYYELGLRQLEVLERDLEGLAPARPQVTFTEGLSVYLGSLEVRISCPGRGNTGGDAVVHVPTRRVLVAGDLLVAPYPYAIGSFIGEWIGTLEGLARIDVDAIIPGHGPVQRDQAYLLQVTGLLRSLKTQAEQAAAKGLSLQAAREAIRFEPFRSSMCGEDPWRRFGFDANFARPGVERAYREAKEGPLKDED